MGSHRDIVPIGQLLVKQGALTHEECERIMAEQDLSGRPFGAIAEELCGVSPDAVEQAWADQYCMMAEWIDASLAKVDPAALATIDRRQAWQFRVMPISIRGNELRVCTTRDYLVRALNFTTRHVKMTCYYVLAETDELAAALMRHYPMEGMSAEMLEHATADSIRNAA